MVSTAVRLVSSVREASHVADCVARFLAANRGNETADKDALQNWISVRVATTSHNRVAPTGQTLFFVAGDPAHSVAVVRYGESIHHPNGFCYVDLLWVDPAHRRSGIGRSLMQSVAAFAREHNCTNVELAANEANPNACDLYESLGYSAVIESYGGIERHYILKL